MLKTTQWKPANCECVIEYTWDSNVDQSVRIHTVKSHRHCGGDHPKMQAGEQLEDTDFYVDYLKRGVVQMKPEVQGGA